MNQQHRLAIVTPGAFPIPSGNSGSVEQTVEQTAVHLSDSMKVYVLGRKMLRRPAKELLSGVVYIRVPYSGAADYIDAVSKRLKALKPKFIQVENRPRFARFLRKRHPKAQIWLILHSTTFISKPYLKETKELRRCLKCVNGIIVNSEFLKNELLRLAPGFEYKISVQHLGVDTAQFASRWSAEGSDKRMRMLADIGAENRKVILFVGRLIPKKGVHHLLEAMKQIREREPEALLIIVGSAFYGSHRETNYVRKLHRMAKDMKDHVRFVPYVAHQDVSGWYQIADVAVVPSSGKEAFGLVNVEAMATGVPVVATRAGGIHEVVEHGSTGYLAELDSIEDDLCRYVLRILENPELQRVMGEQGIRRVAERFTWKHVAERRCRQYEESMKT